MIFLIGISKMKVHGQSKLEKREESNIHLYLKLLISTNGPCLGCNNKCNIYLWNAKLERYTPHHFYNSCCHLSDDHDEKSGNTTYHKPSKLDLIIHSLTLIRCSGSISNICAWTFQSFWGKLACYIRILSWGTEDLQFFHGAKKDEKLATDLHAHFYHQKLKEVYGSHH